MTSVTPRNSSTTCIAACNTGHYSSTGYEPCQPCPLNYYQDVRTQTECKECPIHHITDHNSSQSALDCRFQYVTSSIRLVGSIRSGRIEVYHNAEWGTVCDDSFNDQSALLACLMLGFRGAVRFYTDGKGSGTIWLDDVGCSGTEKSLDECTSVAWGTSNCQHSEDVGVECMPHTECKEPPAPNQNATFTVTSTDVGETATYACEGNYVDTGSGNVTCLENGLWSSALCKVPCSPGTFRNLTGDCDECPAGQYQIEEEQSSCISCGPYMTSQTPRNSSSTCIAACNTGHYSSTGYEPCQPCPLDYYQDVRTQTACKECPIHHKTDQNNSQSALDCKFQYVTSSIRLVGSIRSGRIEVYHNAEWGTVCDDAFNEHSALLACRMLGFHGAVRFYTDGKGSGTIWLDDVGCSGTEKSLDECTSVAWGASNCQHSEDVGVECMPHTECKEHPAADQNATFTVTSTDVGQTANYTCEGIYVDTGNGNVTCLENGLWSSASCKVPCSPGTFRNLAGDCDECPAGQYQTEEEQSSCISCGSYMTSQTPRNSSTTCIAACNTGHYSPTGYEPCQPCPLNYYQDVRTQTECKECPIHHTTDHNSSQSALDCKFQYVTSTIRLVGSVKSGRIELYHDAQWGTVCDDGFNDQSALLACRMLGFVEAVRFYIDGKGSGTIWLDDANCSGMEKSLDECTSRAWGNHDCSHTEDVGVECN